MSNIYIGVQNYNAAYNTEVSKYSSEQEITCSDFNQITRIVGIGKKDGSFLLLNSETLKVLRELMPDFTGSKRLDLNTTAISCGLDKAVIIGFSNGVAKKYVHGEKSESIVFLPNLELIPETQTASEGEVPITMTTPQIKEIEESTEEMNTGYPSVKHLKISKAENLLISGYSKHFKGTYNRQVTLQHTYIFLFNIRTGERVGSISTEGSDGILTMDIIENKKILIAVCGQNQIKIFHYLERSLLMDFTASVEGVCERNMILSMAILPITAHIRGIYSKLGEERRTPFQEESHNIHTQGDILFLGMENGSILSSSLYIHEEKSKVCMEWLPVNLYQNKGVVSGKSAPPGRSIQSMCVDGVVDVLVTGDFQCNLRLFEKTVANFFSPSVRPPTMRNSGGGQNNQKDNQKDSQKGGTRRTGMVGSGGAYSKGLKDKTKTRTKDVRELEAVEMKTTGAVSASPQKDIPDEISQGENLENLETHFHMEKAKEIELVGGEIEEKGEVEQVEGETIDLDIKIE